MTSINEWNAPITINTAAGELPPTVGDFVRITMTDGQTITGYVCSAKSMCQFLAVDNGESEAPEWVTVQNIAAWVQIAF